MMNVEDMNFLAIYDTSTRKKAMEGIRKDLPSFSDEELIEIAGAVLEELSLMSDEDFENLEIVMDEEALDE